MRHSWWFCHSRQAQPGGRPALHQEKGALAAQALGCYLEEALFKTARESQFIPFRRGRARGGQTRSGWK